MGPISVEVRVPRGNSVVVLGDDSLDVAGGDSVEVVDGGSGPFSVVVLTGLTGNAGSTISAPVPSFSGEGIAGGGSRVVGALVEGGLSVLVTVVGGFSVMKPLGSDPVPACLFTDRRS